MSDTESSMNTDNSIMIEQIAHAEMVALPLDKIVPDVEQTRKEFPEAEITALAESIKLNGLITPILVTPFEGLENKYKIVDGERRFRAYKQLVADERTGNKYRDIQVTIIKADNPVIGILANMARKVYNPMESAEALDYIQKQTGLTDEKLGELVEKSRSSVTEYLSLNKLPKEIKEAAKADSCVPFRVLKRLVGMNGTDEDKVAEYQKLIKKYSLKEQPAKKREGSRSPWTADRRAEKMNTKIANFIAEIDKIEIESMTDADKKQKLKDALELLQKKISEMQNLLKIENG